MSYQFDFDSKNRILRCRLEGRVTDEILKEYYRVATEYAARIGPRAGITDFVAVTSFEVSPETIRELAGRAPVMPDPSRVLVVVAPSAYIFGMMRLFQLQGAHTRPNLHVVRTLREAWAVLGVQKPQFE
jgi:hypothetical protein